MPENRTNKKIFFAADKLIYNTCIFMFHQKRETKKYEKTANYNQYPQYIIQ